MADKLARTADGALALNTLDDIRDALRDFDTRLSSVEARKGSSGGTGGKRLDQIEAIIRPFFRDEFAALGNSDLPDAPSGADTAAGSGA